ncbi:Orotidine 5'-phosphate decarboxylase [Candidatus Filomicrobium marinum]|uniref:Orotidine 5'-phosphate decarboxylase n=2 Tax=Filomicrobium TaxID=119044 RepID=A0A0D6JBY6_9HYPH|nr:MULTISPECIES: orotidine-5'-phosphate decarboxylase [Filomicrobium]MCV0370548.1 orotidine-5'-phosphate decarboxylase [Filomicrobium sp.]CFX07944.1 Orotidine 5'-phosphate decarboxylase [Candidatus Filomicrobium marinum]CPR16705.1 Orotidine 5'-phosphate decarboxylase [Candidatus Filomicrobium marinum]SDP59187.1 orotidine-5'-phosphate decarboxylase [Filomicrobium insigne]
MENLERARNKLIVALDVPTVEEAENLIGRLGDDVSVYKIGLELVMAGGLELARRLIREGKQVFLDMKFLDIGHTVERAVANAAELGVTYLTIHGHDRKTLDAAVVGRGSSGMKLLAVTVLTNLTAADLEIQGNRLSPADLVLHRAQLARACGVDGIVASGQEADMVRREVGSDFLIVTPGIRLPGSALDDQQRVMTPDSAVAAGADLIVVGRPITRADDPADAARAFVAHIAAALERRSAT